VRFVTLKKRKEFVAITESGKRFVTPSFLLQISLAHAARDINKADVIRIGYTASKKVGNAVDRSRAKRRLRALVSAIMPVADATYDYVFVARTLILTRDFADLKKDLEGALKKLKLWRQDISA
jgi:ribonuclease P protein component